MSGSSLQEPVAAGTLARAIARGHGPIRPQETLWLLSVAHAVNHALGILLPLVYLDVIIDMGVSVESIVFLTAFGGIASGLAQLSYAKLTRMIPRGAILGIGGLVLGGAYAVQAVIPGFLGFSVANVISRVGGTPQHPVGNALLAEQFPEHRRGFAISAHIAGGNVGTLMVAVVGAPLIAALGWQVSVVLLGIPAVVMGILVLAFVRESGADRRAAVAAGSVRLAFSRIVRDRNLRAILLTSVVSGGGRGLGVVNLFVLIYLTATASVDQGTRDLMYAVLVVFSVPAPLAAGWLSDRLGRRRVIVGVYLGGAIAFAVFTLAGHALVGLWLGIVLLGTFSFAESPQLQTFLADLAPPALRDAAFAIYFTLAFVAGALWVALYGLIITALGDAQGIVVVFWLMAASFVAAALTILRVGDDDRAAAGPMALPP